MYEGLFNHAADNRERTNFSAHYAIVDLSMKRGSRHEPPPDGVVGCGSLNLGRVSEEAANATAMLLLLKHLCAKPLPGPTVIYGQKELIDHVLNGTLPGDSDLDTVIRKAQTWFAKLDNVFLQGFVGRSPDRREKIRFLKTIAAPSASTATFPNDMDPRNRSAVAIVHLDPPNIGKSRHGGGGVYGPVNVKHDLRAQGIDVDLLFFSPGDQRSSIHWHPEFRRMWIRDAENLNRYSLVVFITPGSMQDNKLGDWWAPILDKVTVPIGVQIHDDREFIFRQFPFRDRFYQHPQCCLLLPISEEVRESIVGADDPHEYIVYPNFPDMDFSRAASFYAQKEDLIVSTSRVAGQKRIKELVVEQGERLHRAGFRMEVHGAADSQYLFRELDPHRGKPWWSYHDVFHHADLGRILTPAKFHYNVRHGKRNPYTPRIELTTVEAAAFGCCPIVSSQMAPSWLSDRMAIIVDPTEMDQLARTLTELRDHAHEINRNFTLAFTKVVNRQRRTEKLAEFIREL